MSCGCGCDACMDENFKDGKNPERKGISKRVGIPKNATIAQLEKLAKAKGEKGRMARWQLNMRRGKKKANEAKVKGVDGKACWDGYRYAGTENGKDKCVKIKEGRLEEYKALNKLSDYLKKQKIEEAEYQGRTVKLNKPMQGDVKKFKVYVKDPKTGNIRKVNFGQKGMVIKKDNPGARKSFRARHKCDQDKPKTSAGYWSCKKW
jgi:hypothetical protein